MAEKTFTQKYKKGTKVKVKVGNGTFDAEVQSFDSETGKYTVVSEKTGTPVKRTEASLSKA